MIIEFIVENQKIIIPTREEVISDSAGYVAVRGSFDSEWNGMTKQIVFSNGDTDKAVLMTNDEPIYVPHEVLKPGKLSISVIGLANGGHVKLTTKKMILPIVVSQAGTQWSGNEQAYSPELLEQALTAIGDLSALTTAGKENLVSAINSVNAGFDVGDIDNETIGVDLRGYVTVKSVPISSVTGLNDRLELNENTADERYESVNGSIGLLTSRIDSFTALTDGSTTGDAELTDGRVGVDGTVYNCLGNAIRTQIGSISAAVSTIQQSSVQRGEVDGISEEMLEIIEHRINLFDPSTRTDGYYINSRGELTANSDYYVSDLIAVEPTKKYVITATMTTPAAAFYENGEFYTYLRGQAHDNYTVITPNASTRFIRVNGYTGSGSASVAVEPSAYMVIKGEELPEEYIPHRSNGVIKRQYLENDGTLITIPARSGNLFDISQAVDGKYYVDNTETVMSRYYHSAKIPVTAGETYMVTTTLEQIGCFYTGNSYSGNILRSDYAQPSTLHSVFTVPAGVTHVIVNGYKEEGPGTPSVTVRPEAYMMIPGNAFPEEYIPFEGVPEKQIIDPRYLPDYMNTWNVLAGKTLLTFGDSITDGRNHDAIENSGKGYILNYAGYTALRNGMKYINKGWSGGTISYGGKPMIGRNGNVYINLSDVESPDYITLFYGYNDSNNSENHELGSLDSTDRATFCGAWNAAIPQLRTLYPNARIGVIIPYGMKTGWADMLINICEKYGVPYLDLNDGQVPCFRGNGTDNLDPDVSTALTAKYTYDGTHPNADGYRLISTAYEAFLRRI